MFLVHFVSYWGSCLFFSVFGAFLPPHKWREDVPKVPKPPLLPHVLCVLFNQLCLTLPLSYVLVPFFNQDTSPPSTLSYLPYLGVFIVIEEVLFYYLHRAMHTSWWLYNYVHWWHHTWKQPVAIVALSCHPIEYLATNLFPLLAGPILLQSSRPVTEMWIAIATINAVATHSGYDVVTDGTHDIHHAKRNGNYGILGILDWCHGTKIPIQ